MISNTRQLTFRPVRLIGILFVIAFSLACDKGDLNLAIREGAYTGIFKIYQNDGTEQTGVVTFTFGATSYSKFAWTPGAMSAHTVFAVHSGGLLPSRIKIVRTDSSHPDFVTLVRLLDLELAERDGEDHSFYAQYNKIEAIKYVVLAYVADQPLGCGALKEFGPGTMEIKRMYVPPSGRRKGIASQVLSGLELWARELSCTKCVLETGKRQPEAVALYCKHGYAQISNYGQYAGMENSVCFEKHIT